MPGGPAIVSPPDRTDEWHTFALEVMDLRHRASCEGADDRIGLEQPRHCRVASRRVDTPRGLLLEDDPGPEPGTPERPGRGRASEPSPNDDPTRQRR